MRQLRSFPCRGESVGRARRFAREMLGAEPPQTLEAVELMVSELATNCVRHARSAFEVSIELSCGQIRVAASDAAEGHPTPRSPSPREPTGRGLLLVGALSDEWGVEERPEGKTVWFCLSRGGPDPKGDGR